MSDERNIAQRHRFGSDYLGPVTMRELVKDERGINWSVIVTIIVVIGFWAWVGYNVARWVP